MRLLEIHRPTPRRSPPYVVNLVLALSYLLPRSCSFTPLDSRFLCICNSPCRPVSRTRRIVRILAIFLEHINEADRLLRRDLEPLGVAQSILNRGFWRRVGLGTDAMFALAEQALHGNLGNRASFGW
jgi:hypothetical protein